MKAMAAALGAGLAGAIPELLRLADLEVRIPASRSWPWNASPTAPASRSTPSSPASCWTPCLPARSLAMSYTCVRSVAASLRE
jgi:hypothetical protein